MPTKDLAPFSYISPQKTLFSTIKYKMDKNGPTHKPRYRASAKISFIIAIQPFH